MVYHERETSITAGEKRAAPADARAYSTGALSTAARTIVALRTAGCTHELAHDHTHYDIILIYGVYIFQMVC